MTLLRASLITGMATLVRMAAGVVLNKVLALYVGSAGLAQVAQLGTLAGIVNGLATGGVTNGVTRYVAEHGNLERSAPIVSTSLVVVCAAACASSLGVLLFSGGIARQLLGDAEFAWVAWLLAASNFLAAAAALLIAILNGRKRIAGIALVGIVGSLLSLVLGVWLTLTHGIDGALAAACLAPALPIVGLGAYLLVRRDDLAALAWVRPDSTSLALLARYSVMALTAAIAGPASVLYVRDHLATQLSWEAAGHWQGVWKISEVYLTLATSSLAVYFLPRIAELRDRLELRRELRHALWTVVPAIAAGALLIYLLRDWITVTLYSEAFLPMTVLFPFQLLGDVVKIAAWLFAYVMIARAMTAAYVLTEVVFAATFAALAAAFVSRYGIVGASYAHALNYAAYLLAVWYLTRPLLATKKE
jgi:PST family polysaccharide transporter